MAKARKYNLVGQNSNAWSLMGYTSNAMKECKCTKAHIDEVMKRAMSGDYNNLLSTLDNEIQQLNMGKVS